MGAPRGPIHHHEYMKSLNLTTGRRPWSTHLSAFITKEDSE